MVCVTRQNGNYFPPRDTLFSCPSIADTTTLTINQSVRFGGGAPHSRDATIYALIVSIWRYNLQ